MSNKVNITSARSSSKAHKEPSKKSNSQTRLKIIVRRLPPNLPEPVFWQSVQPWVTDDTVSWRVFYPGKSRKKVDKENIPSRAYLLFKNEGYLSTFSKEYDGHIFRDKQGNESYAIVEFAPNPKVASEKRKVDSKHATIQQDEDYLSFLASLQDPPEKPEVDMEALLASAIPPEEPKITPLLAALREQKEHKAVIQDKKILANDAKAARKAGASSSVATAHNKQEAVPEPSAAAKKGKKGKGKDSGTPFPQTAPPPGKGGRNRGNQATTSTNPPSAAANKNKEVLQPGSSIERLPPPTRKERENERERSRPVIGLGSRHLKAALSGAGVQVQSANPNASSSSTSNPSPVTETALQPSSITSASPHIIANPSKSSGEADAPSGHPRGRGAGREKHGHDSKDSSKEGVSQGGGGGGRGGGGGGREKRNRHPSSGVGRGIDAPPPRILTRQDPPPAGMAINESSGINQDPGSGRGGGGRGRGGRRERGT